MQSLTVSALHQNSTPGQQPNGANDNHHQHPVNGKHQQTSAITKTLFDPSLISAAVEMPSGYLMRPLSSDDYDKGHLTCLAQLTTVGDISKQEYLGIITVLICDKYLLAELQPHYRSV
jgi:hypothetical protein